MAGPRFDPARLEEPLLMPIDEVVRELVELLDGQRVVALLAGVNSTRDVHAWMRREQPPRPERQSVLRSALQAARLITDLKSVASARAWFVGTNHNFDFDSPARVLRNGGDEGRIAVLRAARDFVAEAYDHAHFVPSVARDRIREE